MLKLRGIVDDDGNLTRNHDAARHKWGWSWHLPTLKQIDELINNTTKSWTEVNGINGMLVTSKWNGNSIFLPASGVYKGNRRFEAGRNGEYLGSTFDSMNHASCMRIYQTGFYSVNDFCDDGYTIRPVSNL